MGQQEHKLGPEETLEDIHSIHSRLPGWRGYVESFLRRFRTLSFGILLMPVVVICVGCLGLAMVPGIYLFRWVSETSLVWPDFFHVVAMGCALATGFLLYGVSLVFIVPTVNFLLPWRVKPFRGTWFSLQTIPWFVHNALTYMVRYTFLEFITPTPLNILFYKMMGMKIGRGVVINTTRISDPSLITLEDHVTIGGSATLFAHYGQKGYLIVAPVVIGKNTTIGLHASVMGDVIVGENATIKPHTVLMPKTRVRNGEVV